MSARATQAAVLLGAVGLGVWASLSSDCFAPLSFLLSATLFTLAALSPPSRALLVVVASTTLGILGRVQLVSLGLKEVALRPEEAALFGLCVSCGAAFLDPAWRRSGLGRAWWLFTLAAGLSLAVSVRLWGPEIAAGLLYWVRWVAFGAVLVAAQQAARDPRARERIVGAVITASVVLSFLGFAQFLFFPNVSDLIELLPQVGDVLTDPHQDRLVSTVLDPNLLGAMLATAASLALARALVGEARGRALAWFQLLVILGALLLTVSRGSLLAALCGFAVVAFLAAPRVLWGAALAAPLLPVVAPRLLERFQHGLVHPSGIPLEVLGLHLRPEPSAFARVKSWAAAVEVGLDHPLVGVGYNNYGLALRQRSAEGAVLYGSDSTLLLIFATCGVIGLALFVWLLARIALDALAARHSPDPERRAIGVGVAGGLAALLVAATFTNALVYPPVLVVLWTLGGVVSALRAETLARSPALVTRVACEAPNAQPGIA